LHFKLPGRPNLETLHVPSFGIPGARRLETLHVSIFRPVFREFERQNLKFCLSNSSPKDRLCESRDFRDFGSVCQFPPETELTVFGVQRPAGRKPKLETLNVSTFGPFPESLKTKLVVLIFKLLAKKTDFEKRRIFVILLCFAYYPPETD
jgi:hypothetical protein